jgi:hypothetical protein
MACPVRAQSPIKVHESTKEEVRYAASMTGLQQSEIVEKAVDEYVERHRNDFAARIERARQALLGGNAATIAYASGVTTPAAGRNSEDFAPAAVSGDGTLAMWP